MIHALGRRLAVAGTVLALTISPLATTAPAVAVPLPNCSAPLAAGVDLSGCDLRGRTTVDTVGATLTNANLEGAILSGLDFSGAVFGGANLRGAILVGTDLTGTQIDAGADLTGAVLSDAILTGSRLWCDSTDPDAACATSEPAIVAGATFTGAVMNNADFRRVDFSGLNLSGLNFQVSNLDNALFRATNLAGTNMFDTTATDADFTGATLTGANLSSVSRSQERFRDANFSRANLQRVDLRNALLTRTNFTDADLAGANLTFASFQDANLSGAIFANDTLTAVLSDPSVSGSYTSVGRLQFQSATGGISVYGFNWSGLTTGVNVDLDSPFPPLSVKHIGFSALDNPIIVGIELPETVTSIGTFAFSLAALTNVTIPASVATVGDSAFAYAFAGDSTVTFLGSPPAWGNTPFGFDYFAGTPPTGRCATMTCTMTLLYKDGVAGWPINLAAEIAAGRFPAGTTQQPIYEVSFSAGGASGSPAESTVLQNSYRGSVTLSGQGTLSRPGYSFAGWQTPAGVPVSSPYIPTANITLVPRWTANSGPAPDPSPSPLQAASSASNASTAATPSIPAPVPTELRPGTGTLVVNGEPIPVTLEPTGDARSLTVAGGGITLTVAARSADGRPIPLAPDGSLILSQGGSVPVSGSGFAPGSTVVLYLFSDPILLGEAVAGPDGVLSVSVQVPPTTATGSHTIQIAGSNAAGAPLALSVGLKVESAAAAKWRPTLRVKKRTVLPGQLLSITVTGVQPRCTVRVSTGKSATTLRTGASGRASGRIVAPSKPGTWDVRATVRGAGCDPIATTTRVEVRRK